jgi:hypothetical protein
MRWMLASLRPTLHILVFLLFVYVLYISAHPIIFMCICIVYGRTLFDIPWACEAQGMGIVVFEGCIIAWNTFMALQLYSWIALKVGIENKYVCVYSCTLYTYVCILRCVYIMCVYIYIGMYVCVCV